MQIIPFLDCLQQSKNEYYAIRPKWFLDCLKPVIFALLIIAFQILTSAHI